MEIAITGHIYRIDPTVEKDGRKTRTFVLFVGNERNPNYSDYLLFELTGDRCGIIDMYQVRQQVTVKADLRGRKYEKKDGTGEAFFTSITAWSVTQPMQQYVGYPQQPMQPQTVYPGATPTPAGYPPMPQAAPQQTTPPSGDLPF